MLVLKYLLMILGVGVFGSAAALVAYDIYLSAQLLRLLRREKVGDVGAPDEGALTEGQRPWRAVRWKLARQLVLFAIVPLLLALSIVVIPDGSAGVRISQIWGARPGTLYPGVHIGAPLIDSVVLYDTREQVYTTSATEVPKSGNEVLTVQAREGLNIGLAVSVRYRLDPQRLSYIHANLPQPVGDEVVAPMSRPSIGNWRRTIYARNFRHQARRVADFGGGRHHGAAGLRRDYRARSAAARFETARGVRQGFGRIAVERAGERAARDRYGDQSRNKSASRNWRRRRRRRAR